MSKFKLINLIDKIFITCCVFLIIYAWLNFYIKNLWITFILSIIFSTSCIYLINYLSNKKQNKILLNKKCIEDINLNFLAFRLMSTENKNALMYKILEKNYRILTRDNQLIYQEHDKKILLVYATNFEQLDTNALINLISEYNLEGIDKVNIICNEATINTNTNLISNLEIILTNKSSLFANYFFKHSIYPNTSIINIKSCKVKFKDVLKGFFVPKKAKSYFFCGLILIFSSLILPYHSYYLIFGSLLLLFCIVCKIMPWFQRH